MRTDEANQILGVRLNVWTAALVFLGALIYFVRVRGPREYLIPVGAGGDAGPARRPATCPRSTSPQPGGPAAGGRAGGLPGGQRGAVPRVPGHRRGAADEPTADDGRPDAGDEAADAPDEPAGPPIDGLSRSTPRHRASRPATIRRPPSDRAGAAGARPADRDS